LLNRLVLLGIGLSAFASPLQAEVKLANVPDVLSSVSDCFAATQERINNQLLFDAGWVSAIRGDLEQPVMDGADYFARPDRAVILQTFEDESGFGFCKALANLNDRDAVDQIDKHFGGLPAPDKTGRRLMKLEGRLFYIRFFGDPDTPGVELVVTTPMENK
jgi:hypothetical protein